MSSLLVIRHGQASFGAANYDELSELGVRQSEKLGRYLAMQKKPIDAIYVGPRKRHQQTCDALRCGAEQAGTSLPQALFVQDLDEFPAFDLFRYHYPSREDSSDALVAGDAKDKFPSLVLAWMKGDLDSGTLETATQFESRVVRGLSQITAQAGQNQRVLAITSGGPMMIAMKDSLGLAAEQACKLLWVTANSAVSEFHYKSGELTLQNFNSLAHLSDEDISYR